MLVSFGQHYGRITAGAGRAREREKVGLRVTGVGIRGARFDRAAERREQATAPRALKNRLGIIQVERDAGTAAMRARAEGHGRLLLGTVRHLYACERAASSRFYASRPAGFSVSRSFAWSSSPLSWRPAFAALREHLQSHVERGRSAGSRAAEGAPE